MNASGYAQHILIDTLGDRSFTASAPKHWNRLPSNIRAVNDHNCFKTLHKTHLFRQVFHVCLNNLLINSGGQGTSRWNFKDENKYGTVLVLLQFAM